jgi:hypothetical protein
VWAEGFVFSRANLTVSGPVQKRSKELMEQARQVLKERGDIHKLYQEDGAKAAAAVNGKNNPPGRRPGLDRKRARFSLIKPPERQFTCLFRSLWNDLFLGHCSEVV